jgi:hypothetical protein
VLRDITIRAVDKAKLALQDLAIDLTLRKRTKTAYVPGSPISYTNADVTAKGVITKYRFEEIDGTMIQAQDVLIFLFPPDNSAIPQPNDTVLNGSTEYRVVKNEPLYVGSVIALNMIQGRPV